MKFKIISSSISIEIIAIYHCLGDEEQLADNQPEQQ